MRVLRGLGAALSYFTILPSRSSDGPPDAGALAWLPAIGAATGALAGLAGYAAAIWLHAPWAFVVAWALSIALTGAIHVDGFLDACDGLFATATPQRRLEILRDVHHGSFAVVGMAVAAAFWLAAIAAIPPGRYVAALAFAGALSRLVALLAVAGFPYAQDAGLRRGVHPAVVALVAALALALGWFVTPMAMAIVPAVLVVSWFAARWAAARLGGGLTGDVYGALIVASEVLTLLAVSAVI